MAPDAEAHLVLGASGGVGSAVARLLAEQGKQVVAVNRSGKIDAPDGVRVIAANALDAENIKSACAGAGVIYHCVHPKEDYSTFTAMTQNIISAAEKVGARLVMAASAYPYGKVNGPMREDMPYKPEAPSGEFHARAATLVMDAHRKERVRAAIARASNYFGPNASRMWPGVDFKVALEGEKASVIGDVDQPHTYTYVDDFARGMITLAEHDEALGEVWHVPSAPTITTRQFLEMVYAEADSELSIQAGSRLILTVMGWFKPDIRPALEVLYQFEEPFILNHSKFEKAFGASPTPNEDAIQTTVAWFRKHKNNSG
ncbi:MAG: NAD-dependent epimerase/dehydratase family protein [Anaerolineales bacterium]|nr:NAD-dependent epimerase/dehydratase family protein [Anaerolineales bacterium]